MLTITDFNAAVAESLQDILARVIGFIPNLVGAGVILVVGWIVAALLEWAVDNVVRAVGLQTLFERVKIEDVVKKAEAKKDTTALIAAVVKWIILLVAFIAAADALNLPQISEFFNQILDYIPSVVAAAAILIIGTIFAHFMAKVVSGVTKASNLHFSDLAGSTTRYAILIFTILAALSQLGIATAFLQTLFTGFVGALAIAGGLAFGLGGQGAAKEWLEKFRKETGIDGM